MGNLIDQNPNRRAVTGAIGGLVPVKPGTFVNFDGALFTPAEIGVAKMYLVGLNDYAGGDAETEIPVGGTAIAYDVGPNDMVSARMEAGTYTYGQALNIGANGHLKAAVGGQPVIAWFEDTAGAVTAGDRKNVSMATYASLGVMA